MTLNFVVDLIQDCVNDVSSLMSIDVLPVNGRDHEAKGLMWLMFNE